MTINSDISDKCEVDIVISCMSVIGGAVFVRVLFHVGIKRFHVRFRLYY